LFYTDGMFTDLATEPFPGSVDAWAEYGADVAVDAPALLPRDPVEQITDVATLLAVHTAEQYEAVAAARRDAIRTARSRACADEMVDRSLRLELAAALRITEYAAGDLMARSTALVDRYPQALDALHRARITDQHARFLVDVLEGAAPVVRSRLIDGAVGLAQELPAGAFRRRLRDLVAAATVETLAEKQRRAVDERRVYVEPVGEGMSRLTAHLPTVEAHAIFDRLTRMGAAIVGRRARADSPALRSDVGGSDADGSEPGRDERTLDQVRADILCDLLIDGHCDGHPTATQGIRPTVVVTVPALALLGAQTGSSTVEGVGPIPLERARELCGSAAGWMRVLTHPETGAVLSVGRTRYDPPPELRRLVRWRAERCMAPGCVMPSSRCEIDHTIAWSDGGPTAAENLAPLCPGHHTVKHHGGWRIVQVPGSGGAVEWTSPYGRRYRVEPERRMPFFRPAAETAATGTADADVPAPF